MTGARLPGGALLGVGVPGLFVPALRMLAEADDDVAEAFEAALAKSPAYQTVAQLQEAVPEQMREREARAADALIPCLLSLASNSQTRDPATLAKPISQSPNLELTPAQRETLEHRLTSLLHSLAIESTGHAIEILTQNATNYASSRVFTDVRHVFSRDPTRPPTGAAIVEVLQLQTWSPDGSSDTTYVAMDEADL